MTPHSFFTIGNTGFGFIFLLMAVLVDEGYIGLYSVSDKVMVWLFIGMSVTSFIIALYNTMKISDKEEQIGKIK